MKRICLLIGLFFYTFSNVLGQIRFSKFYDYNHTANLISDVAVLGDSAYFTVSQCVDLNVIDTLNFLKTYLYFIKTNQLGDTIFTKVYHKPRFNIKGTNLLKTNWGYFLASEEYDLKKYHENKIGASYIKLWKIDNFGDTISTSVYDIQNGDDLSIRIIRTNDNGFAVLGQTCNQIQMGKNCDYLLIKLDSNGNKQWHQIYKYNNSSFESPCSIVQSNDDSYYLIGNSVINGVMKCYIVKTDVNGNKLWSNVYTDYPRESGNSIILVNNYLFVAGSYNLNMNGSGSNRGFLMKIDTNSIVVWNKSFGNTKNAGVNQLIHYNNKIYFVGTNDVNDNINRGQAWFMALSLDGDSLFQRLYNPNSKTPEQVYNISKTNDGFLMSGYGYDPLDTVINQDAWLLKVDSFGCLTPGCQLVGIDNIPFSREEIKIYPNPAKENIQFKHSIKVISYRIADYNGKLLDAGNYIESGINITRLPSGSYIVQVLLDNKSQAFGKLIIK